MENVIEIAETSSQIARQVPEVIKSDVSLAASIYVSAPEHRSWCKQVPDCLRPGENESYIQIISS